MPVTITRILAVGQISLQTQAMLARLEQKGHSHIAAENLARAYTMLETFQFDLILAPEKLPDGAAYELAESAKQRNATLLVAVALSDTCLWLPVVEKGIRVLGERALNTSMLEWDVEEYLCSGNREHALAAKRHKAAEIVRQKIQAGHAPRSITSVTSSEGLPYCPPQATGTK